MKSILPSFENLDLYYKPLRCHLSFHQEYPQEIIFRSVDITQIADLVILDPENEEQSPGNHLLTAYASFYDLATSPPTHPSPSKAK